MNLFKPNFLLISLHFSSAKCHQQKLQLLLRPRPKPLRELELSLRRLVSALTVVEGDSARALGTHPASLARLSPQSTARLRKRVETRLLGPNRESARTLAVALLETKPPTRATS